MSYEENLTEIYKAEAEKYNYPRGIHWKMNVAIWTLLAFAITLKATPERHFMHFDICWQILLSILFLGTITGLFIKFIILCAETLTG